MTIMHYPTDTFSKCPTCPTIEVANYVEYVKQGRPTIGQQNELSAKDILQANRLYYCPSALKPIRGVLKVYCRFAKDLLDSLIRVTIVDSHGTEHYRVTAIKGNQDPMWNEPITMYMGVHGDGFRPYFKIQIWNNNCSSTSGLRSSDCTLSRSQTIWIEPHSPSIKHHADSNGYLWFDYNMIIDGNECSPNPCLNGGLCFDELSSYQCRCTSDYVGTDCETRLHRGILKITVLSARNLQYTNPGGSLPSPYVKITTVFPSGAKQYKFTTIKQNTVNPIWNEGIDMGGHTFRAFFYIQIWDANTGTAMSALQTVPLHPGGYRHGVGRLQLHYGMIINGHECIPNPCFNGGRCTDHFCSYTCNCDTGTSGSRCEERLYYRGILRVFIRKAEHLKDTDPINNYPDPYVRVTVVYSTGVYRYKDTKTKSGTVNPVWYENVDMGGHDFKPFFKIQIWESDGSIGNDDRMSALQIVPIQAGSHYRTHYAYKNGYLSFYYNMIIDGNECKHNPCQNGGTCRDHIARYTCNCRSGCGINCLHRRGHLGIFAGYGHDLPDEDGWLNDSDPYIEFIAVDSDGNTVRKTTSTKGGTRNPNWNQQIDFGTNTWKQLRVKVFDSDSNSDDSLSSRRSWELSWDSHPSGHQRHDCYSGFVVFTYLFH